MAIKAQQMLQTLDQQRAKVQSTENNIQANKRLEQASKNDVLKRAVRAGAGKTKGADGEPEEAKFGAGIAIATGLLASTVVGVIPAVMMGIAQGIAIKKEKQSILDTLFEEKSELTDTGNAYQASAAIQREQVSDLRSNAVTPEDNSQIDRFETGMDMVDKLLGQVGSQDAGLAMLNQVRGEINRYEIRNDEQAIIAGVLKRTEIRELGDKLQDRHTALVGQFNAESAPYQATVSAMNNLSLALASDSAASAYLTTAIGTKIVDPTGVIRPEDQAAFARMGGWWQQIRGTIKKAVDGGGLTEPMRIDIRDSYGKMLIEIKRYQLQVELRYADEVDDAGLPFKYHNNYKRVENTFVEPPPFIGSTKIKVTEPVIEAANDAIQEPQSNIAATGEAITAGSLLIEEAGASSIIGSRRRGNARPRKTNR